jgi:hypothetical protein
MQAAFASHWFRFSTEVRDVDQVLDSIAGVSGGDFGPVEHRGMFNQPMRFLHDTGASVYFGSVRDQPIVVDVPGEACELVSSDALGMWAENVGGRVTRIDVAADLEPASHARRRLIEMRKLFRKGQCETRIPKTSTRFYESDVPGDGCTLYIGSTSSDVMCRAYDRRGPLRIEWQWKPSDREVRSSLPSTLLKYGPSGMWRRLGHACVWPCTWYQQLLRGECADVVSGPRKPDDLARTMAAVSEQMGATLAGLLLAGVNLGELAVMPRKPNAEQVRKFAAWVAQARDLGYDPAKLDAEVKRWRRSR